MLPDQVEPEVAAEATADESAAGTPGRRRSGVWLLILMLLVPVAAGVALVVALHGRGSHTAASTTTAAAQTYVVPAGTGAKIDAGEKVEIIPEQLTLRVGETLVIVNQDDRQHNVGGYQVRAGDTLRISYPRPGLYMNSCSANTSNLVYVHVVA